MEILEHRLSRRIQPDTGRYALTAQLRTFQRSGMAAKEAAQNAKAKTQEKPQKRVLALPDLEQAKSAVLNTLTSKSGQRSYAHAINEFVDWYCSEPRLALNRGVVLRY